MRKFLVVLAMLAAVFGLWGQEVPPGYDAASFARIGVGVRALGMAGAAVAVAEGPLAVYWNPAALAGFPFFAAEGMYTNWMGAGIHYQYLLLAGYPPLGEERPRLLLGSVSPIFGLGWISVVIPDIPYVDEEGNTGVFSAGSHMVLASMGFSSPKWPGLSLGATIKVYHDRILEGVSFGLGLDAGLVWKGELAGFPLFLGLATTDIAGSKIQWYGTTGEPVNYVPWLMRIGVGVRLWEDRILLAGSYEWGLQRPRFERLRVGAEVSLAWVSLRFGYDWPLTEPGGKWRAGLGVRPWNWMSIDYAFIPGALGDSHLLALQVVF